MSVISGYSGIKLNLSLQITGRDSNGYHELSAVTAFCHDVGDYISLQALDSGTSDELIISGPFASELKQETVHSNLIIKTLNELRALVPDVPFYKISLEKNIPLASGLGGGSCDAMFVLRQVISSQSLDIADKNLMPMMLKLGADMPVCYMQQPCIMEGIGEKITFISDMPTYYVLMVNPLKPLSAGEVYQNYAQIGGASFSNKVPPVPVNEAWLEWLLGQHNDLQAPAMRLCPEMETLLLNLSECHGAKLTRMSGSGATCFAVFEDEAAVNDAEKSMRALYPNYWICNASI